MLNEGTFAELFNLSIQAERKAEELYRGLAERFTACTEVSSFWKKYAAEETGHARWLERLRDAASPADLALPAGPVLLEAGRRLEEISVEILLQSVHDLEDAYQLATELENGETNLLCDHLLEQFGSENEAQAFLRVQLQSHIANLKERFPVDYRGVLRRRGVLAR